MNNKETPFPFKITFEGTAINLAELTEDLVFSRFRMIRLEAAARFRYSLAPAETGTVPTDINALKAFATAYLDATNPPQVVDYRILTVYPIRDTEEGQEHRTFEIHVDVVWIEEVTNAIPSHSMARKKRREGILKIFLESQARNQPQPENSSPIHFASFDLYRIDYAPTWDDATLRRIEEFKTKWTETLRTDLPKNLEKAVKASKNYEQR